MTEQFNQYQQNYHRTTSQLVSLKTKKTMTYDDGNPDPGSRQAQNLG